MYAATSGPTSGKGNGVFGVEWAGDAGAAVAAKALARADCRTVSLCMDGCGLTDVGAAALAEGVALCGTLEELLLVDNSIGDEGASALAEALASPTSRVRCLHLAGNAIGPAGGVALGCSLERNVALQTAFLMGQLKKGGGIGDEGAAAWTHGIALNRGKFWFANLNNNGITEQGLQVIRRSRVPGKHHIFPLDPYPR